MKVVYSVDRVEERAGDTFAAAATRRDGVTLRVQPALLQPDGRYRAWKGVAWTLRCEGGVEEAEAVREALKVCFEAIAVRGPRVVEHTLATARDGQTIEQEPV